MMISEPTIAKIMNRNLIKHKYIFYNGRDVEFAPYSKPKSARDY